MHKRPFDLDADGHVRRASLLDHVSREKFGVAREAGAAVHNALPHALARYSS
jgi:hypothetical protein